MSTATQQQADSLMSTGQGIPVLGAPASVHPWLAYLSIAVLQLKCMWGLWQFKDLTRGDSHFYYEAACVAADRFRFNPLWSPIFALFGSISAFTHDPYCWSIATRIASALTISLLFLAVARRLFPAALAWFAVAWWVLVPTSFNCRYEIDLFTAVPVLGSWLLLSFDNSSRWRRGAALGILAACSGLLMGNYVYYACTFALSIVAAEIRLLLKGESPQKLSKVLRPYLVPLLFAFYLVCACQLRTVVHGPVVLSELHDKQTATMGAHYAWAYQQARPGVWNGDAWADNKKLMTSEFGQPSNLPEAWKRNPKAVLQYFRWNARMIPASTQLLLFGATSDHLNPELVPCITGARPVALLSMALVALVGIGLFIAYRRRKVIKPWLAEHSWTLAAMSCYGISAVLIMVSDLPNPDYVLALAPLLIVLVAFCFWQLMRRWQLPAAVYPIMAAITIIAAPSFYMNKTHQQPRTLLTYQRFLSRYLRQLSRSTGQIAVPVFADQLPSYLYGRSAGEHADKWVLLPHQPTGKALSADALIQHNIQFVVCDTDNSTLILNHSPSAKLIGKSMSGSDTLSLFEIRPDR